MYQMICPVLEVFQAMEGLDGRREADIVFGRFADRDRGDPGAFALQGAGVGIAFHLARQVQGRSERRVQGTITIFPRWVSRRISA